MSTNRSLRGARERDSGRIFTVILFSIFVISLLLAIYAGTGIYRSIASTRDTSDATRLGLNLIANNVHATDATGGIAAGTGPEGRSLVLVEHLDSGTYETRIYLYQGNVVEEYALAGAAYTPAKAAKIASSSQFSYTYENGLLIVTTDQGSIDIALRTMQAGA